MLYIEDVLGDPIMRESVAGERHGKAQRMASQNEPKLEEAKEV
jgi:hypothetical protein